MGPGARATTPPSNPISLRRAGAWRRGGVGAPGKRGVAPPGPAKWRGLRPRRALRARVALALAPGSARPPKGETATPVHTAIPEPTEPGADTTGGDLSPPPAKSDSGNPATRLDAAVAKFLAAANSDDDAGAERASTPDCWSKECSSSVYYTHLTLPTSDLV